MNNNVQEGEEKVQNEQKAWTDFQDTFQSQQYTKEEVEKKSELVKKYAEAKEVRVNWYNSTRKK